MPNLNERDKRTIRYAAIGLSIYLVLFGGAKVVGFLQHRRADYLAAVAETSRLKSEVTADTDKAALVKKMMDDFQLEPAKLFTNSVVAGASAAIQKAITGSGLQPGPIRESPGRSAKKEIASIQFESAGQVAAIMSLLHRLPLLGYPIVIDSVQITADPMRPGQIKLAATVLVLDYQQWINEWKKGEPGHA